MTRGGVVCSSWRERSGLSPEDASKWKGVQGGECVCVFVYVAWGGDCILWDY